MRVLEVEAPIAVLEAGSSEYDRAGGSGVDGLGCRTILLAIGDFRARHGLANRFRARRFRVLEASDEREAALLAVSQFPDAILCEWAVPDGSGIALLKSVRADAGLTGTAFLLLAAPDRREARLEAFGAGVDELCSGPIDEEEILLRVEALLERRESLLQLAYSDPLTSLGNRRFFERRLEEMIGFAERYRRSFGLLYLDIDHFKLVNDTWGHGAGDEVLRTFSSALRAALRKSDLPCRLGGEEFAVLLPEIRPEHGTGFLERLRVVLPLPLPVEIEDSPRPLLVQVSGGLTFYRPLADTAADLCCRADRFLYQAKRAGRAQFWHDDHELAVPGVLRA